MVIRYALGVGLAIAMLSPVAPASAAPFSVDAAFSGRARTQSCSATTCTITDTSTVCQVVGMDPATGFVYTTACVATLKYELPRIVVDRLSFCAGRKRGTFTLELTPSGTQLGPVGTEIVAKGATTTWVTDPLINLGGAIYAGQGKGKATSLCELDDAVGSTFGGRFSYVRV